MGRKKKSKFRCKTEAQKKAIAASYARKAEQNNSVRIEAPYPHFRYYKKSHHPALVVGEQSGEKTDNKGNVRKTDEYRYRKVMHRDRDGRHLNEKVEPNPDPTDNSPMYIANRVRHDEKDNFENKPLPWKYSPKKDK